MLCPLVIFFFGQPSSEGSLVNAYHVTKTSLQSTLVEIKTETYNMQFGSGSKAQRRGGVWQNSSQKKATFVCPKAQQTLCLNVLSYRRTNEFVHEPIEDQKQAVDVSSFKSLRGAPLSWLLNSDWLYLLTPCHARQIWESLREQNQVLTNGF